MKVFYRSLYGTEEIAAGSVFYAVPGCACLEIAKDNSEQYEAIFNGTSVSEDTTEFHFFSNAELTIYSDSDHYTYSVRPLIQPLSNKFSGAYRQFFYEYKQKALNEIESIRNGSLKMYAVDQSTEDTDWTGTFNQIEKTLKDFKAICEKPKSHLKAVNEVRPIDTVKRVGYESIPYLASHSEDWQARTAGGLKPARLFSRVEDDDYQIYENRVVKTLIDLIIQFLRKKEKGLKDQCEQLHGIIDSGVQTGSFGFDVIFQKAVSELLVSDADAEEYRSLSFELAVELHDRAASLLKKYRSLRQSRLYRYLKRTKPVTNPLNETNILLLDKHYGVVFKLWKSIHKVIAPLEVTEEEKTDYDLLYAAYLQYCISLFGYTAHVLRFSEGDNDGSYFRDADHIDMRISYEDDIARIFFRDREKRSLTLSGNVLSPIRSGEKFGRFSFSDSTLSWENDITSKEIDDFCSLFKTRESRGKVQSEEKKRYNALKQAIDNAQRDYPESMQAEIIIIPAIVEIETDNRSSFVSYVEARLSKFRGKNSPDYIIITMPRCDEGEQKITSYAKRESENTMFLPISMFDINSFRRFQNVMLRIIMKFGKDRCPCCGGTMRSVGNQFVCDACNQLTVTKTICPNLDCRHEYTYLGYDVSAETVEKMNSVKTDNFYQLDSLYQYKDIVDMTIQDGRIRSICPYCEKK